jgi:hypothetical protein
MNEIKPEHPANVGLRQGNDRPTPDAELAEIPAEMFVERYVQTGFKGTDPHGVERIEHMWVLVTRVEDEETVHGLIENDPVLDGVPRYGAAVDVRLDKINKVTPEFK